MRFVAITMLGVSLTAYALALSACGSSPHDTAIFGHASANTYCGNGVWGTVDKNNRVHCPND